MLRDGVHRLGSILGAGLEPQSAAYKTSVLPSVLSSPKIQLAGPIIKFFFSSKMGRVVGNYCFLQLLS